MLHAIVLYWQFYWTRRGAGPPPPDAASAEATAPLLYRSPQITAVGIVHPLTEARI
jgi:hypothetical protein